MMYGIVLCSQCGRKRIIDLECETSSCPYCNRIDKIEKITVLFSDRSQSVVRKAFSNADSEKYKGSEKKRSKNDPDPMSTLMYRYEHTSGTLEKLSVLAAGLTRIKGDFDEKDVEDLFPGKGEQMIRQMIKGELIIETGYGRFKTV